MVVAGASLHNSIIIGISSSTSLENSLSESISLLGVARDLKGTSRQRSGKGAIRKKIPTPKTAAGKKNKQTNNKVLIP